MNNEPPQTLPSFDPTCYSDKENSVPCVSKLNFVDESSNIFNPPPQPPIYSCEFYGSNAHYGHYFTPQVPFIILEPGYSQDFNFPQDIYDFQQHYLCCDQCGGPHKTLQCLFLAWHRVFEIKDALGNKQYKPEDTQKLFRKLLNDVQIIHEELAKYINTPGWNRPDFYDDDDDDDVDYTISITTVLSTEEPDNSLSMGDEHLDTISATKSDEVIKSSVEDLVPILSESEGIPDPMCDVHLVNNPTPLEAKDHFEIVINSNDDISSKVAEIVIPKEEEIEDDNLCEKLLNVHLLIAKIEALKDNPTPSSEFLTKSSSTSPESFLEETSTFHNSLPEFENFCFDLEEISSGSTTTHSDISLSDFEAFYFDDDHIEEISSGSTTTHSDISLSDFEAFYFDDDHIEEISSGSTTTHSDIYLSEYDSFIFNLLNDQFPPTDRSDFTYKEFTDELAHIISPPEYDCFYFRNFPDPGELISILNFGIYENLFTTRVNLPVEDDHSPLLAYVLSSIPRNLKALAKGFYPPSLHILSFILGIKYPNLID
nr:hypothetical protein [Tanacetum cinerariifolium]